MGPDRAGAAAGEGGDGPADAGPPAAGRGGIYRYRTGIPWQDLPAEFGPWQTAWKRHHRFSLDGTWDKALTVLQAQADAAGEIDWQVSVDSTIARVHQHAATLARSSEKATSHTGGAVE